MIPIKVQIVFENDAGGPAVVQEVARLERDGGFCTTPQKGIVQSKTVETHN